jgi:hypothetical protein
MRIAAGLVGLLLVAAIGLFIVRAQFTSRSGDVTSPKQQINAVGVRTTLLGIAQAERLYAATHGTYASIAELQNKGYLPFSGNRLHGYKFETQVDGGRHFTILAKPLSVDSTNSPTLSIDETMKIVSPSPSGP